MNDLIEILNNKTEVLKMVLCQTIDNINDENITNEPPKGFKKKPGTYFVGFQFTKKGAK